MSTVDPKKSYKGWMVLKKRRCLEMYFAEAKPQVSLTAPNCDHFAWIFLDAMAKAKKLIRKSIAQNLK